MEHSLKEIKERISVLRKQAGITQEEMAEKLEISQPAYSYYESGDKPLPLKNIRKIAEIFSVPISSIMGDMDLYDEKSKMNSDAVCERLDKLTDTLEKIYSLLEERLK